MAKREAPEWFLDMLEKLTGEALRLMKLYEPRLNMMKQVGMSDDAIQEHFEYIRKEITFDVNNSRYWEPIPNENCRHAVIRNVLVSNEVGFKTGEYTYIFGHKLEKVYAWTHTKDKPSSLIIQVDTAVMSQNFWITLASILELAYAISTNWTGIVDMDMEWVWDFAHENSVSEMIDNQPDAKVGVTCVTSKGIFLNGICLTMRELYDMITLMNLLYSDKKLYLSARLLFASYSCNYPANEPANMRSIRVREYELWETCKQFALVDNAIVQATRAVESLIGQPSRKVNRCEKLWKDNLDLNPSEIFVGGISYLKFWMTHLFYIRNSAAHAGKPGYLLSRRKEMAQVQEYANHLIHSYIHKHSKSIPANVSVPEIAIQFNEELVKKLPKGIYKMSQTCITADNDCFPPDSWST